MTIELTKEHADALYNHATNMEKARDYVYAIRLLERLVEIDDPFYTPFALVRIAQNYKQIGRLDLEAEAFTRITRLPPEQQRLVKPGLLALCYQRVGNLGAARKIHGEILVLTPHDPGSVAALAELFVLEGNPVEAERHATELRESPEPAYQILGRLIAAFVLAFRDMHDAAGKELYWVGQFLISSGNVPLGTWDYGDLQPLTAKTGRNAKAFNTILDVLNGNMALPEFIEQWKTSVPSV
jgi:tetratricopeptide (TPR) repeat protein